MVLRELERTDLSGYSLIKILEQKTGKKPSSGYLYPLLHSLEAKKLVKSTMKKRQRVYLLTPTGKDLLINLLKQHRQYVNAMVDTFEPLQEKKDAEKFYAMHTKMLTLKEKIIPDMDVLNQFRIALFEAYQRTPPPRQQLRNIIKKTTQSIKKISR